MYFNEELLATEVPTSRGKTPCLVSRLSHVCPGQCLFLLVSLCVYVCVCVCVCIL